MNGHNIGILHVSDKPVIARLPPLSRVEYGQYFISFLIFCCYFTVIYVSKI